MGDNNRQVKERMIEIYGPECFIEKLKLRKDEKPRRYRSKAQKRRMKELTYHHIKEKHKGGKATEENGALLSVENHQWFNEQSKEDQDRMNKLFQKYKVVCAGLDVSQEKIKIKELLETELEDKDYPKEFRNKEIKLEKKKYKNIARINDDPEIMEV